MREYKFNIDDWTGGNTIGKSMGDAVSKDYTDLVKNCLSAHTINVDTTGLLQTDDDNIMEDCFNNHTDI